MIESTVKTFIDGWYFCKTPLGDKPDAGTAFQRVRIPHDWLIYDARNLYEDSCGWYRKRFERKDIAVPEGGHVILRFDGVYMNSTVYCNGARVGDWKYGYSTFDMEITEYLKEDENEILVQVRHQSPNSRWYSGAGIFRNVWLKVCGPDYLPLDGTYVVSRPEGRDYRMELETEVINANMAGSGEETGLYCRYRLSRNGEIVQELGTVAVTRAGSADKTVLFDGVPEGAQVCRKPDAKAVCSVLVKSPERWSIKNPQCYDLTVELLHADRETVLDSRQVTVGFREFVFDPEKGLFINGEYTKVHGVCEHHDFGCLGSGFSEAAMLRKFKILRGMGVNAIRTSHNMPASELMEMADRLGFLVMSEAFDMWERPKTTYDYGCYFKEWCELDVRSWIRRDRNHPSLLLWSIGNEIYDTHADEHGQDITRRLMKYVRDNDPGENAPITIGSNYMPWENARKCADIVKYAGYNYAERYYGEHHAEHPDWIIYGSETASVVQSRGIYHFPLAQPILADEDEQCSALGNSCTSWGAKSIEQCIIDDRDATFTFGQFLWTGFDYIGEPTPYHTKNSYFGQIDTAGFAKDSYYIFQAEWTDGNENPMVHLYPYWDFNPGQRIDVRACSNAAAVELFVNGRSLGKQEIDHAHGKKLSGEWQVPYEPGVIEAVAYDAQGREVARDRRESFGDSARIVVEADKTAVKNDGKDLIFLTISTVDREGHPVENAVDRVKISVDGAGRLVGTDNGDSTDYDSYQAAERALFSGKLLAVVEGNGKPGEIRVRVTGDGLEAGEILLTAEAAKEETETQNAVCARMEKCAVCDAGTKSADETGQLSHPVRKVELSVEGSTVFSPEQKTITIRAKVLPENADGYQLIWKAVNDAAIPIGFAEITPNPERADSVQVTAIGDGSFRIRCMVKDASGKITVISQLECEATGLGQAFLNPYEFITAGLCTDSYGEIGNGNEKGIATGRDGENGPVFENVDFGPIGSDEITIPIFALNSDVYEINIWLGKPYEEGSRVLAHVTYQKPTIWNTYQAQTWKLPERIRGVATIAFTFWEKVHVKGFSFKKYERAYEYVAAGDADKVYGDSFVKEGTCVNGIGNNVTLEFEEMDFGETGADRLTIWGSTPLACNTIHVRFTRSDGELEARILEFEGSGQEAQDAGAAADAGSRTFAIEPFTGSGKIEFVFLPGSNFDFRAFRFSQKEE